MPQPTLDELRQRVDAHHRMDWNDRMLDDPPGIAILRRCRNCGKDQKPFVVGWDEIIWAVDRNEPLPERMDLPQCQSCEPDDDDE